MEAMRSRARERSGDEAVRRIECYACAMPAASGRLECLEYLRERGYEWKRDTCAEAAANGQLECLRYAHEHGCPWDEGTCRAAALKGQLDCLKYAHEHGCPWDVSTCECAARFGQMECLRYAHEHGCPLGRWTCADAAWNGHLECLRYAHEHGCPWTEHTCADAVWHGHLECLRYAIENGCHRHESACLGAAARCHWDCLKYAHEHGCPWDRERRTLDPLNDVRKRLEIVRRFQDTQNIDASWLYDNVGLTSWWCAFRGSLDCLRYARDAGIEDVKDYDDLIDEYDRVWRHFVVLVALCVRGTTDDDQVELSARRFRQSYKDFDGQRKRLKDRARERAILQLHDHARRLGIPIE